MEEQIIYVVGTVLGMVLSWLAGKYSWLGRVLMIAGWHLDGKRRREEERLEKAEWDEAGATCKKRAQKFVIGGPQPLDDDHTNISPPER